MSRKTKRAKYSRSWLAIAGFVLAVTPSAAFAALPSAGVALAVKQTEHCSALTPRDWVISSNSQASTLDTASADHSMYAGWGVVQINQAMRPYYGPMYGDPQTSMQTLVSTIVRADFGDSSGIRYTSAPRPFLKFFAVRSFASQRTQGIVFYHIYPVADPNSYIESVYFAINSNAVPLSKRTISQGVAVSIRCQTQLVYHAPEPAGNRGASEPTGCGGEGNLRGYNKELGWQYAHTSGGANLLFDDSDWRNGPQGEGYYAIVGNSLEKLELGRSDDC